MPAVVIVACGTEYRTAFVSDEHANGDLRTMAAVRLISGFKVGTYILATGPMPSKDCDPTLWAFPLNPHVDIHTHIARFQRWLGSGRHSVRADVFKAITATTRTITPHEVEQFLNTSMREEVYRSEMKTKAKASRSPPPYARQLTLF